jgi:hypothetical protein
MRDMGEWPITWPKHEGNTPGPMNIQRASRYACETCRLPHPEFKAGIPVIIGIVETGEAA